MQANPHIPLWLQLRQPGHETKLLAKLPRAFPLTEPPDQASLESWKVHPEGLGAHRARFQLSLTGDQPHDALRRFSECWEATLSAAYPLATSSGRGTLSETVSVGQQRFPRC
eukprot:4332955-Amphidinium_carterae.1